MTERPHDYLPENLQAGDEVHFPSSRDAYNFWNANKNRVRPDCIMVIPVTNTTKVRVRKIVDDADKA